MLKSIQELDAVNAQKCLAAGWIAMEPKSGDHLKKLPGYSDRYLLNSRGWARVIIAKDDQDAIDQANRGYK